MFRKRADHGEQPPVSLALDDSFFGAEAPVAMPGHSLVVRLDHVAKLVVGGPSLQSQVVGDAEKPAGEIVPGPAPLQVAEKCQKDLLHHFLALFDRETQGEDVPEKSIAKPVEETKDILLEPSALRLVSGSGWNIGIKRPVWA